MIVVWNINPFEKQRRHKKKPPLSKLAKKWTRKKYVCVCVFVKFFASKPQIDVCVSLVSLYSLLFVCQLHNAHTQFCWRWRLFPRYTLFVSSFRKKVSALMGYANGICNLHTISFFQLLFFVAAETTIECWTLIEFTEMARIKIFSFFHSLRAKMNLSIKFVHKLWTIPCQYICGISHIGIWKIRDQVLSKSTICGRFFASSIPLTKWIFMCIPEIELNMRKK